MAWTSPRTWLAGELVTAGMMNTYVRDDFNALQNVRSFQNGTQTTGSAAFADLSPAVSVTAPGTGAFDVSWGAYIDTTTGTGQGFMRLLIAGAQVDIIPTLANGFKGFVESAYFGAANSGDVIKLQWHTNGGTPLLTGSNIFLRAVGPS